METTEPPHCLQVLVPALSGEGVAQNSRPLGAVTCFISALSTSMGFIGWQAPVAFTVTLFRKSGPWGQDEAAWDGAHRQKESVCLAGLGTCGVIVVQPPHAEQLLHSQHEGN